MYEKLVAKLQNYAVSPETGCWEWTGYIDKKGYGRIYCHGNSYCAHRIKWELFNGVIPVGAYVLHTCENRKCINIEHLYIAEQRKYVPDKVTKRAKKIQRAFVRRLVVDMQRELYVALKASARRRNCTVSKLIRRMIVERIRKEKNV